MSDTETGARGFLGAGDIYINRLVGGVPQGRQGPFLGDAFSITPQVENKSKTSKGRYSYGQTLASVNLPQDTQFTMALSEVQGTVLAMAFLGNETGVSVAAGTMTDKAVVVTKKDVWLDIGHKNLDAAITVEDAADAPLTEGTDYELNRPMGWIRILPAATVAIDSSVKVSGAYKAVNGTKIEGSTQTEVRALIEFDGINKADGTQCTVTCWEAVVSADSEFDFLSDEFGNVNLTGTLVTPKGKPSGYEVLVQKPVA